MRNENKEIWIKAGYEIFSLVGQIGLKIEPLATKVGKSKSSFYHHFVDLDLFIDLLLQYHIKQSYLIAEKEKNTSKIDPDLINVLLDHRTDLLFNRQLRINQHIKSFSETLLKSNKVIGEAFKMAWVKELNSKFSEKQIEAIYLLAIENFYLQINEKNLNYGWLSTYFLELKNFANNLL